MDDIKGKFPAGIKGDSKEFYLSDAEFQEVIGMTKDEWKQVKLWKRQNKK